MTDTPHEPPRPGGEAAEAVRRFAEDVAAEADGTVLDDVTHIAAILRALASAVKETAATAATMADEVDQEWERLADELAEVEEHTGAAERHAERAAASPIVRNTGDGAR